ncbi:hypothetical protein EBB07_26760 [Paenibacillaceae bacterium]|nr:hypothetical protein EBB07_26760 [Paenibacillaceae bacterium]
MNNKKWLIVSAVIGMAVSGTTNVYAGRQMKQIKAYLNHDIEIVVNGSVYTLKNESGATLVPITYENTTYLPTRAIADALGVPIVYDAKSNKVFIGSRDISDTKAPSEHFYAGNLPASSSLRPQYLPSDFPIPQDAKVTDAIASTVHGTKSVTLIFLTKESVSAMGEVYRDYTRANDLQDAVELIDSNSLVIAGKLIGKSPLSITGGPSAEQFGYTDITIVWSEQ